MWSQQQLAGQAQPPITLPGCGPRAPYRVSSGVTPLLNLVGAEDVPKESL